MRADDRLFLTQQRALGEGGWGVGRGVTGGGKRRRRLKPQAERAVNETARRGACMCVRGMREERIAVFETAGQTSSRHRTLAPWTVWRAAAATLPLLPESLCRLWWRPSIHLRTKDVNI